MSEKWHNADILGAKVAEAETDADLLGARVAQAGSDTDLLGAKVAEVESDAELTGVKGAEAGNGRASVTEPDTIPDEPATTAEENQSNPIDKVGDVPRYTESDVLRLASAVASRLSDGDAAARELEYLQLREELAAEKRLRLLGENKLTCVRALEAEGIPVAFADLLVCEERGRMEEQIALFVSAVRDWINREVSGKLCTLAPKPGNGEPGITKAQFRAMRVADQQEIYRNNRPLYEELSR